MIPVQRQKQVDFSDTVSPTEVLEEDKVLPKCE